MKSGFKCFLNDKWFDRLKQFGLPASLKHIAEAALRPVYRRHEDVVLAVIDHKPELFDMPDIIEMTPAILEERLGHWKLNQAAVDRFRVFLAQDCRGFVIERHGHLAAYAFVQYSGIYDLAGGHGKFLIPPNMAVLKNLLVFSEYRGDDLGKHLNRKRLSSMPEGCTPLGFVIAENRYAFRNLRMYGFRDLLKVNRMIWFNRYATRKFTIIEDIPITHRIIDGLKYHE